MTDLKPRLTYREMRTRAQVILDEAVKERVLKGIEVLNEKYGPDWVDRVDVAELEMANGCSCVLGQVYGDYLDGVEMLTGRSYEESGPAFQNFADKHGFFTDSDDISYRQLDEAWTTVLS